MEVYTYIEGIIKYAEEHLLLDSADEDYARGRLCELLHLAPERLNVDVEELESMTSPDMLLKPLLDYAAGAGIVDNEGSDLLAMRLMDCLVKRPGETGEIFTSLAGKNCGKALSWVYDYNEKNGYVRPPLKAWEAKATRGKIEVLFRGADKPAKIEPLCGSCRREGLEYEIALRPVTLELEGQSLVYLPQRRGCFSGHSRLALSEHRPLPLAEAIKLMLAFTAAAAGHFAAYRDCGCSHGHLMTGDRLLPLHRAPATTALKSKEYPYIQISLIDWYVPALRLVCSTKEKLGEFATAVLTKWQGKSGVSVRRNENDFIFEIVLGSDRGVAAEHAGLTAGKIDLAAMLGAFALEADVYEETLKIEKLLTKELTVNTVGNLDRHKDMVSKLIKEAGTAKLSPVEAALDVKDIVSRTLESALSDTAYPVGEELMAALNRLGIEKHI